MNIIDPLGLLIASMVIVCVVMIWAIIDAHMTQKKEREWEEFNKSNGIIGDDGVEHTKEYYDRDRNR